MTRSPRRRILFKLSAALVALSATLILLEPSAHARSDEDIEARESEIFGSGWPDEHNEVIDESDEEESEEDEETDEEERDDAQREREIFGDSGFRESDSGADLAAQLATRDEETLEIGGELFSQVQYSALERGAPLDFPLSHGNLLDVYLDGRPNERLRVFVDGRLRYSPAGAGADAFGALGGADTAGLEAFGPSELMGDEDSLRAQLDQLWLKFDIARAVYITAGRQHLRWGVGRFWYPNDFLFEQRRDPLALFDVRTGVDIVKAHIPVESLGWNFYAVANLEGADSPREVGGALRAEFLLGLSELGLSAAAQRDQPTHLGADISAGVGWFDLNAALSFTRNMQDSFWRGESNFADFDSIDLSNITELKLPERFLRAEEWIPRALLGAEVGIPYNVDDTLYIGAEYFYNGAGYDSAELYTWLLLNGDFRPLYNARHYAGLYLLAPAPGDWNDSTFSLATLGNLSDRSFLSRLDYSVNVLTHLRVFLFGSVSYGQPGELTFRLKIPALSAEVLEAAEASGQIPSLEGADLSQGFSGLNLPSTRAIVGAGLRLNF